MSQVAWRVRYLVQRRIESQSWFGLSRRVGRRVNGLSVSTNCPQLAWKEEKWINSAIKDRLAELQDGCLTLLNEQRPFAGGDDWCMTAGGKGQRLWKHHLQYHAWMLELAVAIGRNNCSPSAEVLHEKLDDWLQECRLGKPGFAAHAWNSFAIATRLESWGQLYHLVPPKFWADRSILDDEFLNSFAVQATYLHEHIEWDLRGNHLIRDAVGLAWAGRFFEGANSQEWLRTATRIAVEQVDEQILADGAHFERSPMYHVHVMEDVLSLAMLLEDETAREKMRDTWTRMAEHLVWMRHPDGDIPLFNDGALNAVSHPDEMLAHAQKLDRNIDIHPKTGGRYFSDMGMVVWHGTPWTLFFDVGEVGPEYQPGHAHADTLSIECSYAGKRLFVDPGTHSYDDDERRRYDRSTCSHNTVCIDETDSSEVWHIFRVGSRARPVDVAVDFDSNSMSATAAHDGYMNLPGSPKHVRGINVANNGRLQIEDRIAGRGHHRVEAGLLLAPEWSAEPTHDGWIVSSGNDNLKITVVGSSDVSLSQQPAVYHPEYGLEVEASRLQWTWKGSLPCEVTTVVERTDGPMSRS